MRMPGKQFYEFGPYRMDPARSLLLRGDQSIPLTSKAFETLLILVQHSDQEVSKDELMKKLWPDTFVEETNLTKHISMVRKALGETAQDHRYILTLPGRGYRFAEKVRTIQEKGTDLVLESRFLSRMVIEQTEQTDVEASAIPGLPQPRRRLRVWILAATASGVLLLLGLFFTHHHRKSMTLGESDLVLVSDFVNTTGDPVFDDTLKTALNISLRQ